MIEIKTVSILSNFHYELKKIDYNYRHRSGKLQSAYRIVLEKDDGAAIVLYNRASQSVVLVEQFRLPVYLRTQKESFVEACAGLLDGEDPLTCIQRELIEETGYRVKNIERVCSPFMSPGAVTEQLHLFIGEMDDHVAEGGGLESESEDIRVLEITFLQALEWIKLGKIRDAKTIIILQYMAIEKIFT